MRLLTLVMGASLKEVRYSNKAIRKLRAFDHPVKAFGLRKGMVLDVEIDTKLIQYEDIHTVTLYLNAKRQQEFYDYIIALQPKRVLFNPGTENSEFYELLRANNIFFEEACTLVLLSTSQY